MALPLLLLAFGSIYCGYLLKEIYIGIGSPFSLFRNILDSNNDLFTPELVPTNIKLLPVILSILGALLTLNFQKFLTPSTTSSSTFIYKLFTFLSDK